MNLTPVISRKSGNSAVFFCMPGLVFSRIFKAGPPSGDIQKIRYAWITVVALLRACPDVGLIIRFAPPDSLHAQ
jgi:hypothetical protein